MRATTVDHEISIWRSAPRSAAVLLPGARGTALRARVGAATHVSRMVAGLNRRDDSALSAGVTAAAALLRRLDIATGLGVYTPQLKALCGAARAMGIAAKPSGAGGGDCGIAIIDTTADPVAVPELLNRWRAAGITPLSLQVAGTRGQETSA